MRLPPEVGAHAEEAIDAAVTGGVGLVRAVAGVDREQVRQAVLRRARRRGILVNTRSTSRRGLEVRLWSPGMSGARGTMAPSQSDGGGKHES